MSGTLRYAATAEFRRYNADLWRYGLIERNTIHERLADTELSAKVRDRVSARIRRDEAQHASPMQQTHNVTKRSLRLAEGHTASGPDGPVHHDVEPLYRAHHDAIPATLVTGPGRVVFGLSTHDGNVTPLYRIGQHGERAFARWMRAHTHLWGTPFHDPQQGDGALARYVRDRIRTIVD